MSTSKFAHLKTRPARPVEPPPADGPMPTGDGPEAAGQGVGEGAAAPSAPVVPVKSGAKAREKKAMIAGHFSPEAQRRVRVLAAELGVTVQHLLGEALDDLMRKHGKHPFGER